MDDDAEPEPGADGTAAELLPLLYDELRRMARGQMARESGPQTLTATALVHEAWLRLSGGDEWRSRRHFFGAAAEAMRRILIERARRVGRRKHGGDRMRVTLVEGLVGEDPEAEEILALDEALSRLEALVPEMAEVVKLHQFAGLSLEETAAALGTSERTVSRRWTAARAWLKRELSRGRSASRPAG